MLPCLWGNFSTAWDNISLGLFQLKGKWVFVIDQQNETTKCIVLFDNPICINSKALCILFVFYLSDVSSKCQIWRCFLCFYFIFNVYPYHFITLSIEAVNIWLALYHICANCAECWSKQLLQTWTGMDNKVMKCLGKDVYWIVSGMMTPISYNVKDLFN